MAKMMHRVLPADYVLSALESLYLLQHTLVMFFSQYTSTTLSYFPTVPLYKNIHGSNHALVAPLVALLVA